MNKNYYVEGITQDWLLKPGMVIYVEREYDKVINDYIDKNYTYLHDICEQQGLTFLYIPKFYPLLPKHLLKYYTGKTISSTTMICTKDILTSILSDKQFRQIQGPSFLFTGSGENKCIAFSIEYKISLIDRLFTSRKEKIVKENIELILSDISVAYGGVLPQIERPLFVEEVDKEDTQVRFSIREINPDIKKINNLDDILEEEKFESDACEKAQKLVTMLLSKGYSKETIWALLAPIKELSQIRITVDLRIMLPLYNMEIILPPVQKAVYLLFLRHLRGINFKDMPDYENELYQIYRKIAVRGDTQKHVNTIAELVNPLSNSMNEKCSIIKSRITALLDDDLAKHYYISGGKGELKKIDINNNLIVWE